MEESNVQPGAKGVVLDELAFSLHQTSLWLSKCFALGSPDFRAQQPESSERMDAALTAGTATLSARFDMTGQRLEFILNCDDGPSGASQQFSI